MNKLKQEQFLPITIEEAWHFFQLQKISMKLHLMTWFLISYLNYLTQCMKGCLFLQIKTYAEHSN